MLEKLVSASAELCAGTVLVLMPGVVLGFVVTVVVVLELVL